MFFARREAIVATCAFAGLAFASTYATAQDTSEQIVSPQPSTAPSAAHANSYIGVASPESKKATGLPGWVKPIIGMHVKNGVSGDTTTLTNIVVQSWFSTEPVIMPTSGFVFQGISAYYEGGSMHGTPCPKSNPVPDGHGSTIDSFCIYGATFDQYGYYSTKAPGKPVSTGLVATPGNGQILLTWPGIADANSYVLCYSTSDGVCPLQGTKVKTSANYLTHTGLTNNQTYYYTLTLPDHDPATATVISAASATPFLPISCPKLTEVNDEYTNEQKAGQSQVPLTYRDLCTAKANTAMYLLRPFLQPGATSISFSDQVGINGLPRWTLVIGANPTWIPWLNGQERLQKKAISYLSFDASVNLNNQIEANPNSTMGALEWNLRSRHPLSKHWFRTPGLDTSLTGVEYDFVSNDINLYYPSASIRWPLAALDYKANPAVFVWKLQLGEISGYHIHDPSAAGLAGSHSVAADIAEEGTHLFRGVAGSTMNVQGWGTWLSSFSVNSTYQVMLPTTDEPFTIPSSTSSKPPTITLTDKGRHWVKSAISEKLGDSNFSWNITYQYGSLPPAFWLVKHSLAVGVTLSSGSGRTE
jgi:hypothetical protein